MLLSFKPSMNSQLFLIQKDWMTAIKMAPLMAASMYWCVLYCLVLHIKATTDPLLDPLQFAYRASRSVDDAVNMAFHFILQHLDSSGTYTRILFVDFRLACNTIIPALLEDKPS